MREDAAPPKSKTDPSGSTGRRVRVGANGEQRFRALAETAHDAIFFADEGGAVVFWNRAAESMFGFSAGEIAGRSLATIVPPRLRKAHEKGIERALAGNLPVSGKTTEITGLRKDGHEFPIELTLATWQEDGKAFLTAIARDITDRKKAEAALQEREERYRSLFEESPIGLWEGDISILRNHIEEIQKSGVTDLEGHCRSNPEAFRHCLDRIRLLDVNRSALEIYEADDKDQLLQGLSAITCSESEDAFRRALLALAKGNKFFEAESVTCTLKGSKKDVFLRWVVTGSAEAPSSRLLMSIIDLSSHKKLEAQFLQSQKMEALGRLAGGVAHDFNNLLSAITTNADLLLLDPDHEGHRLDAVAVIIQTAEEAGMLTRQLLDLSRREDPALLSLDINEAIRRMSTILPHLLGRSVKLQLDLAPEIPAVMADPGRLDQIILNLAVNARDAMPDGGRLSIATRPVVVEADETTLPPELMPGRYVRFTVSDTGTGIAPKDLPHIFEPFYTTKDEGTGLGLSTTYGIVGSMGGNIEATCPGKGGSIFTLHLPAAQSEGPR